MEGRNVEHRAFWGDDLINVGKPNTPSRQYMGAVPPRGEWVRLEVPASSVGLEGRELNGMAFTLWNGRACWDTAGIVSSQPSSVEIVEEHGNTAWFEERLPAGVHITTPTRCLAVGQPRSCAVERHVYPTIRRGRRSTVWVLLILRCRVG